MTTKEKIPLTQPRKHSGRRLAMLVAGVLAAAGLARGAEPVPATTAWSRTLLRSTNASQAITTLGFLSTNMTSITNYTGNAAGATNLNADELRSGTVAAARLTAPVGAVATNFAGNLTNLNANALTGTVANARLTVPLQSLGTNNGVSLTNLDGTQIQAGTVNSNALDADTLALISTGAGTATNAIANTNGAGTNTHLYGTTVIDGLGTNLTSAGGNARGESATDLQVIRNDDSQVASGAFSAILGGISNTAAATYGTVAGGVGNEIGGSGNGAFIGGGGANSNSGTYTVIGGGVNNLASGNYGVVAGGYQNQIVSAPNAFIGGGQSNSISSDSDESTIVGGANNYVENGGFTAIGGGRENYAGSSYSAVAGGYQNTNSAQGGFIGSGQRNYVSGLNGSILGGTNNYVTGAYGTAIGNSVSNPTPWMVMIGYGTNTITVDSNGVLSAVSPSFAGTVNWSQGTTNLFGLSMRSENSSEAVRWFDPDTENGGSILRLTSTATSDGAETMAVIAGPKARFVGNGGGLTNVGGLSTNGNNYFTGSNTFAGGLTVSGALILTNDGVQMYSLSTNPGVPEWDVDVDGVTRTKTSYGFFSGENRLWSTGYVGNASGATNLNATELRSGIVAPDRLGGTNGASDGWSWTLDNGTNKLALIAGGNATNAVATISSNGVAIATTVTNLDFWPGANITLYVTNRDGHADVAIASTGGAGATFDPNQFGGAAGGTNLVDGVPLTNANIYVKALISVAGGGEDVALASITGSVLQFSSTSAPWGADAAYLSATGMVAKAFSGAHGGDGSLLTALNASSLASGTVPLERLAGVVITNGYPIAVDLPGGLTSSSITITGAGPGSLVLSNAANTARVVELGTNSFINTNLTVAGDINTTNLYGRHIAFNTNAISTVPDFLKDYCFTNLTGNIAFSLPINADSNKVETIVMVLTSANTDRTLTPPAGLSATNGTWHCTNYSTITWFHYGKDYFDATCHPKW